MTATGATAIGVLGPLQVSGPDGPVRIGSARQRRLLAVLVAHLGAPVGVDRLADLVWPGDGPADPAGAVQTNVARLRRLLPAGVTIATVPEGYVLRADRSAVDVTAFADEVAAASEAPDPAARSARLAAALLRWRGDPFAELDHPALAPEVARLAGLRAEAVERHAEAQLATGAAAEAITALEALAAADPWRESTVALLMRALVAVGRQRDALDVYAGLRARLADELGLDPGPVLRELERQVLRQEVAGPAPSGPSVPVSSFVGRDADLARAVELLARKRVLTLCGPGGVGKTRLARHVAAAAAARYPDGVLVVEFGEGGAADVEPAVAAALTLADGGAAGAPLTARIVDVLAVRQTLLVLDNCEHVADEVAALVEAVCTGAVGADLLLTSREPLRVDGEQVLPVEPLPAAAAASLLRDRILAADPDGLPAEPGLVDALCARLDGLPLALELAAARVPALGVAGLLDALGEAGAGPLEVLRGGRRTAAARHRSLRDVVEWSFGLLDERRRTLFERLAVFAGPVEIGAVEAVCGDADALPDLVDRSLVVRVPGEPDRFGMLETLRAFGRSRLATDRTATALRDRHAAWAVALADEVRAARRGPGEAAAVRRFDDHLADLRRAHARLCEVGPLPALVALATLFGELGYLRGRVDLVRLAEQALVVAGVLGPAGELLDRPGPADPAVARLLGLVAAPAWQHGDLDRAEALGRRAIALADAGPDPRAARDGWDAVANVASFRGDLAAAADAASTSLRLSEAADDTELAFVALTDLTLVTAYAGDDDAAAGYEAELVRRADRLGSPTAHAFAGYVRGERRAERDPDAAAAYLRAAVRDAESVDARFVAGIARHTLATSAVRAGADPSTLLPLLDHWHAAGAWLHLWVAMRALVGTLAAHGRPADAAVLLGALRASPRATAAFGPDSVREREVEQACAAALGGSFALRLAEGAALGDAAALALARRLARARPDPV